MSRNSNGVPTVKHRRRFWRRGVLAPARSGPMPRYAKQRDAPWGGGGHRRVARVGVG